MYIPCPDSIYKNIYKLDQIDRGFEYDVQLGV